MRLLDTGTYQLKEFPEGTAPPYAILSHTWGDGEVSFQDLQTAAPYAKSGFTKIQNCCLQAVRDELEWAWVDTCCIDKSSSAELSEAINSMYKWYQNADVCYAYLEDVPAPSPHLDQEKFKKARWFTRGWCLQELIAPRAVEFFGQGWTELGTKLSLQPQVSEITGIRGKLLRGAALLSEYSTAERMSWASYRQCRREEDVAYCLLGIFEVNMPLLYGEGKRAFIRLQEEIIRRKETYSILVWVAPNIRKEAIGSQEQEDLIRGSAQHTILSNSPANFPINGVLTTGRERIRYSNISTVNLRLPDPHLLQVVPRSFFRSLPCPRITSRGLHISLFCKRVQRGQFLAWTFTMCNDHMVCISLFEYSGDEPRFRLNSHLVEIRPMVELGTFSIKELYLDYQRFSVPPPLLPPPQTQVVFEIRLSTNQLFLETTHPTRVSEDTKVLLRCNPNRFPAAAVVVRCGHPHAAAKAVVFWGWSSPHFRCLITQMSSEDLMEVWKDVKGKYGHPEILSDRSTAQLSELDAIAAMVKRRRGKYFLDILPISRQLGS